MSTVSVKTQTCQARPHFNIWASKFATCSLPSAVTIRSMAKRVLECDGSACMARVTAQVCVCVSVAQERRSPGVFRLCERPNPYSCVGRNKEGLRRYSYEHDSRFRGYKAIDPSASSLTKYASS